LLQSGETEISLKLSGDGDWKILPLLTQLKERGATDYYAHLVMFGPSKQARTLQDGCILFWNCDHPDGFSEDQISLLRWLGSRFGVVAKLDNRDRTTINIVSAYLGSDAGRRVLDGQIKLGDGEVIPAVIWFSDLRQSTLLADTLPGNDFLQVLNTYFQCTAGAVLDHGGEVLRFISDAVLAIFHVDGVDGRTRAARVALAAAHDAERCLADVNKTCEESGKEALDFGLGIHLGDLMFGHIGVPERVEFSVVGPAANEVARLENLTKDLDRRILVS
jgi:adenylate cyclase